MALVGKDQQLRRHLLHLERGEKLQTLAVWHAEIEFAVRDERGRLPRGDVGVRRPGPVDVGPLPGEPQLPFREVAGLVRMSEAIEKLPRGYDSVFGEESLNLSGGQKQRLALARALIRDPHILVLDEFTSGLDPETEKEILDDLFLIFRAQTIVCITHKQAVADRFDRVFYMPAIDEQAAEA